MTNPRKFLTDAELADEIRECMRILSISRMPTASELKAIDKYYVHNKICRTHKYSGWANMLGLSMKSSETNTGKVTEELILSKIEDIGLQVTRMSSNHPYDILVGNSVKVDVKGANPYSDKYSFDAWTFNLSKRYATCDIYILVAYGHNGDIARILVIPSAHLDNKVVTIGTKTKYDKYLDKFEYLKMYDEFFGGVE